jgi:hypothetical protein
MTSVCAVMNNYPQGFGPPASPANSRGFPPANSPGPIDMYSGSTDSVGYVQATSPQPSGFQTIAVSRAPVSYNPVSDRSLNCLACSMHAYLPLYILMNHIMVIIIIMGFFLVWSIVKNSNIIRQVPEPF